MNLLIDTSIIIDFLRQKEKESSVFYQLISQSKSLYISIITYAELFAGKSVWKSNSAQEELNTIFSGMQILPLEKDICRQAGRLRANYNIDLIDALIAATAIFHHLPLVTINKKHFETIKNINLYK